MPAIIRNLLNFHDFRDKTIIAVGAGGGQLIEYARPARHVIAVDCDGPAIELLKERLKASGLAEKFTVIHADFLDIRERGDVVLFEFSLHETADPAAALDHARLIAPAVVVLDHFTDSRWAYLVSEEEKVEKAWRAIDRLPGVKKQIEKTEQVFATFTELYEKVQGQGETTRQRIEPYRDQRDFTIPMTYALGHIPGIATGA